MNVETQPRLELLEAVPPDIRSKRKRSEETLVFDEGKAKHILIMSITP